MKNLNIKNHIVLFVCLSFIAFSSTFIHAQEKKKKARVSLHFNKIENISYLKISGKYKDKKKYKPANGLALDVFQVFENDSLVSLGTINLNKKGAATIDISKVFQQNLPQYDFKVFHKATDTFKKVSKTLTIQMANLAAKLITKKDTYFIEATLTNAQNEPVKDAELKVQLQRLFAPLAVGKGIYFTDENGMIHVPVTEKMPGVNGKLNYEVVLDDSDDFGTIKSIIATNIGKPIKDLSTFDQRTMWSPPSKAPWFDIIIPNLLILGIWGYLVILVINLYRISKHKNS
jgi:hypothetical protein